MRPARPLIPLLAAVFFASACNCGGVTTIPCSHDSECATGSKCVGGKCTSSGGSGGGSGNTGGRGNMGGGAGDTGVRRPGNRQTTAAWPMPATQADPGTGKAVGWSDPTATGTVGCAGGERATWSGTCRRATAPQLHDTCAPGDFNCDGLSGNNDQ